MSDKKGKKQSQEFVKLYVPELLQLMESGDEKSCLMMAQLEYWFGKYQDGFYKFMTAPKEENPAYKRGDSWVEDMGMSKDKIENALRPICTRYKSQSDYKAATDKFKGKYYCSYYHKPSHKTYYLRNHDLTNKALASLSLEKKSSIFRAKHSSKSMKQKYSVPERAETRFPGNGENVFAEAGIDGVVYTKNIKYSTQREIESHSPSEVVTQESNGIFEPVKFDENSEDSNALATISVGKQTKLQNDTTRNGKKPFPEDFQLTEEMRAWAVVKRPDIDVESVTDKFIHYHKNNYKDDWKKAWELWILNENSPVSQNNSRKRSQTDVWRELYAEDEMVSEF